MKQQLRYILWTFCATLWIAIAVILPDFLDNPVNGLKGFLTVAAYISAISVISFGVLYILGINKYVAAVGLPVYGIIGAAVSYYRVMYKVTVTPTMLDCIFHTHLDTVRGVIAWQLVVWLLLNIAIAIGFVWWRWRLTTPKHPLLNLVVMAGLVVAYYFCNGRLHQSLNLHYPMIMIESGRQYHHIQQLRQRERVMPDYKMTEQVDSLDIVVVIGESVRPDHLFLNGYSRPTTPLLAQRDGVVSLPYVRSQYTHTAASVPLMMTRADSLHPEYQYCETSFAKILRQQGFHCKWISNQNMSDTYVSFPAECDTAIWVNLGMSTYAFVKCYDEDLLPPLRNLLKESEVSKNLVVLHTIGSHWYYNNHVPEEHYAFFPVTDNRVVTNNTIEQVINSYDNTIRYCDFVLDSIIQCFEDRCAVLLYLSDHGESLGENGQFLHASDAEEQKHCACIVWYSQTFAERFPQKVEALHANCGKPYRTDFLFHSVLSLAGLSTMDSTTVPQNLFKQD